jgi:transcriptional regulator with XRE-family HTH domain
MMLVQKLRLQRGWSQEQLAEISGLSVRTIQRVERGQPASLETLKALGAVFNTDLVALKEPDMSATYKSPNTVSPEEALALAHVRQLRGFYTHVIQYVIVNLSLLLVNVLTWGPRHYVWAIWPMLFWGVGLSSHAMRVFNWPPIFGAAWEKREVERYLGRTLS